MKPENVPDEMVEKALQSEHRHHVDKEIPEEFEKWTDYWTDPEERETLRFGTRVVLASVWDDIYGSGFTEGFSTKISMEKAAQSHERAAGPAVEATENGVIIVDAYDEGMLEVAYRKEITLAPLTMSTRGHWSVDMKMDALISAVARAGGPRLFIADKEAAAKIMRDHRAQVWSSGNVECRCGTNFPSGHLREMRVAERADALLTDHERHVYRQVVEAFYE